MTEDRCIPVKLYRKVDELPDALRRGAVAIGKFDGVHWGHVRIIERLLVHSRLMRAAALVFTFDPPPEKILRANLAGAPLCWIERKAQLLAELGVDAVVAYPTDRQFLRTEARVFFEETLRRRLDARAIIEGPDFCFGHDRLGTVEQLRRFCQEAGVVLEVVDRVEIDGRTVSSSRIRSLLAAGQVAQGRALLGRPHRIRGRVVRGADRGMKLGFPTANLEHIDTLLPGEGVYAARALLEDASYPAAVSIGENSTFGEAGLKVEAHLIDFAGALYDRTVELDFLARLRDINRFDTVETLVAQIGRDVVAVRRIVQQDADCGRNRFV